MNNNTENTHIQKKRPKKQIDKLIAFFKNLNVKTPKSDSPDYSSWDQTESEYQKEQAEWLEAVKKKKRNESQD